jgi:hypothetical protein
MLNEGRIWKVKDALQNEIQDVGIPSALVNLLLSRAQQVGLQLKPIGRKESYNTDLAPPSRTSQEEGKGEANNIR